MLEIDVDNLTSGAAGDAARSVSLRLDRGVPNLLVGQNGAGKSSLLRCLAGIGHGTVQVRRDRLPASISVAAALDFAGFDPSYRCDAATEEVHLALRSDDDERVRFASLCEQFGLTPHLPRRVRDVSLGTRQKLRLALTLARRVDLVLLDEPYRALDRQSCELLDEQLHSGERNADYVLVSSHHDSTRLNGKVIDANVHT